MMLGYVGYLGHFSFNALRRGAMWQVQVEPCPVAGGADADAISIVPLSQAEIIVVFQRKPFNIWYLSLEQPRFCGVSGTSWDFCATVSC
jgi:hypothetical protein